MSADETLAAVSGCLLEVFRGALEARKISAGPARLTGSATAEWDGLEMKTIHMRLHLQAEPRHQATAERVLTFYAHYCPLHKKYAPNAALINQFTFEALPPPSAPAPDPAS